MAIHRLKTIQPYFEECWNQGKTFEVRLNDRDFKRLDTVYLLEYDNVKDEFSGRELECTITYILYDYPAIKTGYCIFSFVVEKYINR